MDLTPSRPTTSAISIPLDFCCPISGEMMRDPVILSDGTIYDRESIQQWFRRLIAGDRPLTSPLTRAVISREHLIMRNIAPEELFRRTLTPNITLNAN